MTKPFENQSTKNYIIASPRQLKSGDRYVTILRELNQDFAHEFLTGLGFGVVIKNGKFQGLSLFNENQKMLLSISHLNITQH